MPELAAESLITAPNGHAIAVMLLTVLALYLFTRERIPLELSSFGLLAILAVGFSLVPYPGLRATDFFLGLGHEALVAVCALMVVGQGLVHTGALEPVGRALGTIWGKAPFLSFLATLVVGVHEQHAHRGVAAADSHQRLSAHVVFGIAHSDAHGVCYAGRGNGHNDRHVD